VNDRPLEQLIEGPFMYLRFCALAAALVFASPLALLAQNEGEDAPSSSVATPDDPGLFTGADLFGLTVGADPQDKPRWRADRLYPANQ
jgi:hypothetical protein